ncbi:MotA/TolQ/ExbB proton channel family protein [Candidatus Nitrotoga sp. M5]|uniref:MotA/TolQ/ExbB proton channel family protein n=1 Tax=Candidatus Nitrotoga sp. M5 TaxID=2890409 RepID=UPI001EF71262|nr:MotA/TolQ/ExbB proton channel family protein [Candidatus Nitrotoga sp. M5]CAH1388275.1 Ferric siderophore transport system, biopolymer transport protein ExbB [Candidatus Nitrotoga sp. M5]
MFVIVEAAGWPIWFLIAASVIAVGIIGERLINLRNKKIAPAGLFNKVVHELKQRGVSHAMISRLEEESPLGRIFAAGLKNIKSSPTVMKESVEETGRAAAHELERFLTTLGTIASVSPLLGLFGTMVGMIEIFGVQNTTGNGPAALAHGISIALYNTAFGLMVAIPSMIFYRHFRAKVASLTIEMEQQAIKLIEIIHGARQD